MDGTKNGSGSFSFLCIQHYNSMLSTNSTTVDATHQLLQTTCPESSCSCFSRHVGFLGFNLALGTLASNVSSSSPLTIPTSSRGASIGSMSSPIGARSVFRVYVGLTSALLCPTQFPAAENCSHFGFLLTSLLCSKRY